MNDKERLKVYEQALARMLEPLKGIPLSVIIKSMSETQVIPIDKSDASDRQLIKALQNAVASCASELKAKPIERLRPMRLEMTLKLTSCGP